MNWLETTGVVLPGQEAEIHTALLACRDQGLPVLHHFKLETPPDPDSKESVIISCPENYFCALMALFSQKLKNKPIN